MSYQARLILCIFALTYLFLWIISAHTNIKALTKEIEQLKKDKQYDRIKYDRSTYDDTYDNIWDYICNISC